MNPNKTLLEHLQNRPNFRSNDWITGLSDRKQEEMEFHNFERETVDDKVISKQVSVDVHANRKFYSITQSSNEYVEAWLNSRVGGGVFLDYACGNGEKAIQAIKRGAALAVGLDISDVSIRNAKRAAKAERVSDRCYLIQGDCEDTELPDSSIDTILCCGMLHHLDLAKAYRELFRILKPGGRILGVEALGHNPIIQLYRNRTPHLRTEWEKNHILRKQDILKAEEFSFELGRVRYWHLLALAAVPLHKSFFAKPCLGILNALDRILLRLPGVRLLAWQVTFELIKPVS
jgi:ubiquinone/menaquinone biosynthesis C-methylase UbiE